MINRIIWCWVCLLNNPQGKHTRNMDGIQATRLPCLRCYYTMCFAVKFASTTLRPLLLQYSKPSPYLSSILQDLLKYDFQSY